MPLVLQADCNWTLTNRQKWVGL